MKRFLIVLCFLSSLICLFAYSPEDANRSKPLFANDRFKIKLTEKAMHNRLPNKLGEISTSMEIPELDARMKEHNVSDYSLAHRAVNDKIWEQERYWITL